MKLIANAPYYTLSLNVGQRRCVLQFVDGKLDTATEAGRIGITQAQLDKAIKAAKDYGVRFVAMANAPESDVDQ